MSELKTCAYCGHEHSNTPLEVVSPERAREIWSTRPRMRDGGGRLPLTAGECSYVKAVWEKLPGEYSYSDTVLAIGRGATLEAPHVRTR